VWAATLRHGGAAHRRDVAAAAGVPPGVDHAVRARQRRVRVEAQPRLPELQPEDERHRRRAVEPVPGPQDRRLRHLHAPLRPRHQPAGAGLHRGAAGVLRDGDGGDDGAPLQPQVGRDVPERDVLRVLGRRPPVGGGQPSDRRLAHHRGPDPRHVNHSIGHRICWCCICFCAGQCPYMKQATSLCASWEEITFGSSDGGRVYLLQTTQKVITRCLWVLNIL
jgi:hypothetical protein